MTVWTLTRNSRPVRWEDADGVRRELWPGDAIPEEALAACPESRVEAHKGGGTDGGRILSPAPSPALGTPAEDYVQLKYPAGAQPLPESASVEADGLYALPGAEPEEAAE